MLSYYKGDIGSRTTLWTHDTASVRLLHSRRFSPISMIETAFIGVLTALHSATSSSYKVDFQGTFSEVAGRFFYIIFSNSIIATPSAYGGRYAGCCYSIVLCLVLYVYALWAFATPVAQQRPLFNQCSLPETRETLVKSCGPELVDQFR